MSPEMKRFLTEWLEWAEGESPEDTDHFRTISGLCFCARCYGGPVLEEELDGLFEAQSMCAAYPFGKEAYRCALDEDAIHKDPNRLAWVRKQLGRE